MSWGLAVMGRADLLSVFADPVPDGHPSETLAPDSEFFADCSFQKCSLAIWGLHLPIGTRSANKPSPATVALSHRSARNTEDDQDGADYNVVNGRARRGPVKQPGGHDKPGAEEDIDEAEGTAYIRPGDDCDGHNQRSDHMGAVSNAAVRPEDRG